MLAALRSCAVGALLLGLSACVTRPPAFWDDACASESGPRRYATPTAAGLAIPDETYPERTLILTGAAWVEVNRYADQPDPANYYAEGAGRYAISLVEPRSTTCEAALTANGFSAESLERDEFPAVPPPLYSLRACTEAKRIGDLNMEFYDEGGRRPRREWLDDWSAPYIVVYESDVDARSSGDLPVSRVSRQVINRTSGEAVVEDIGFYYAPPSLWFPSIRGCGAAFSVGAAIYPERIFAH